MQKSAILLSKSMSLFYFHHPFTYIINEHQQNEERLFFLYNNVSEYAYAKLKLFIFNWFTNYFDNHDMKFSSSFFKIKTERISTLFQFSIKLNFIFETLLLLLIEYLYRLTSITVKIMCDSAREFRSSSGTSAENRSTDIIMNRHITAYTF